MKKLSDSTITATVNVLKQFVPDARDDGWTIEQLGEGEQARVFRLRSPDRQPIWRKCCDLVIKLYKSAAESNVDMVRGQFQSLHQLHARLNGSVIHGWRIHTPEPVHQSEQPLALVMTMVPGRPLNCWLESAGTPEIIESIAQAVAGAMDRFWSVDSQIYGDPNFDNILCDDSTRSLSFIDPGVLASAFLCNDVARIWYPASRDLAYMLFDTEVAIKRNLGNRGARQRQRWLIEGVLQAFLEQIESVSERIGLLSEIESCARVYLAELQSSWSARGLWRMLLRSIASRRIEVLLHRLRTDAVAYGRLVPCINGK